jgi:hypothetical protein
LAVLALAGTAATSAMAQALHPEPKDRNAALVYASAFYAFINRELTDKVDAVEVSEVGTEPDPSKQGEKYQAAAKEVSENHLAIETLLRASKMTKCDFELPFENGINVLLPHLSLMRKSARLLRFDARRMLIDGKPDEAAERIAAIYRMAGQLKSDSLLINTLVAVAIGGVANSESEVLIKSGKLTAEGREAIVAAIQTLDSKDPYGFKDALRGERHVTVDWVRNRYKPPHAGERFAKTIESEWGMIPNKNDNLNTIAKMDDQQFANGLGQLESYHDLLMSLWDLPDAPARLDLLGSRIEKGDFGPFAGFMAPAISKACMASQKSFAELAATQKHLKDYRPPAPNSK